jgi:hypothetical protein
MIRTVLSAKMARGSGGPKNHKGRVHHSVFAAPSSPPVPEAQGSSLARRQSPWARVSRLGRQGFRLMSNAKVVCDIARA